MDVAPEWIRPGGPSVCVMVWTGRITVLPGMELMGCPDLAVPAGVMHHVVSVESSFNPYAIGVVGGRLARQPGNLTEALATARMLERRGFNFSLGLAQVNRYNLGKYGLGSYERAFQTCPNLQAGSRILAECHQRSGQDWGKSFSCYYSGNFTTGFREGYVQKVFASMRRALSVAYPGSIPVHAAPVRRVTKLARRQPVDALSRTTPSTGPGPAINVDEADVGGAPFMTSGTDALVVLQPDGRAPTVLAPDPTPPAGAPRGRASPERDTAFVF